MRIEHIPFTDEIKTIVHCGDIHIRNWKRHEEYRHIFDKFYAKIDTIQPEVIVVAGDVAHSKTDMSPELIRMIHTFFVELCNRTKAVIVIPGNHDANLNNDHRLDVLTPIVESAALPNLFYFKKSGLYQFNNVVFGVMSILETADKYPLAVGKTTADTKIALWHGALDGSQLDTGMHMSGHNQNVNMFNGYDIAMLADIHKLQFMNKDRTVAYCSSLIQQNFGESFNNHGFLTWDVRNRKAEFTGLTNPYGYFTINIDEGRILNKLPRLTNKNRVRVKASNTDSVKLREIVSEITTKYKLRDVIVNTTTAKSSSGSCINDKLFEGNVHDLNVQQKLITDYISTHYPNTDSSDIDNLLALNKQLNESIAETSLGVEIHRGIKWRPKRFTFSNMFSYGEDNEIIFDNCKGVYGIFGPNAVGKSSLLDAWCFCMFDETARTYKAVDIMNVTANNFICQFEFSIENETFIITKKAKRLTGYWDGKVKVDIDFKRIDSDGVEHSLNGEQRRDTVKNIEQYLGSFKEFVMTTMSVQGKNSNFIDQTQSERKDLLAQFLDLGVFDSLYNAANKEFNRDQIIQHDIEKQIDQHIENDCQSQLDIINSEIKSFQDKQKSYKKKLSSLQSKSEKLNRKLIHDQRLLNIKHIDDLTSDRLNTQERITNLLVDIDQSSLDQAQCIEQILDLTTSIKHLMSESSIDELRSKSEFHDLCKTQYQDMNQSLQLLQNTITNHEKKIIQLHEHKYDPNCEFCVNNIFVQDAIKTKASLVDLKREEADMIAACDQLLSSIQTALPYQTMYNELMKDINKEKELQSKLINIRTIADSKGREVTALQAQIESIDSQITLYHKNESDIKSNAIIQQELSLIQSEVKSIQSELSTIEESIFNRIGESQRLTLQLQQVLELEARLNHILQKRTVYDLYTKIMNRDGIPYELIMKSMPIIQDNVNAILEQLVEFGMVLYMDGKNINAYLVHNEKHWPLETTSGMERFISSIALRIALLQITTLSKPNFLLIDEGFGVLDSTNTSNVYMLFNYIKDLFDFTFVVSHIDQIKDMTDNVILIEPRDGKSYVSFSA